MYTLKVEFAGTHAEAREFAVANKNRGVKYAPGFGSKPNGLPYLTMKVQEEGELKQAMSTLVELGWDEEFVEVKYRN